MPIYEYECESCTHRFDKRMKVGEPNPPCPKPRQDKPCGEKTKKLISRSSFQLKGGGWYKDGY